MKASWIDTTILPEPNKQVWVLVDNSVLLGRYSPIMGGWCHEMALVRFNEKNRGVTHWHKADIPLPPNPNKS